MDIFCVHLLPVTVIIVFATKSDSALIAFVLWRLVVSHVAQENVTPSKYFLTDIAFVSSILIGFTLILIGFTLILIDFTLILIGFTLVLITAGATLLGVLFRFVVLIATFVIPFPFGENI